jgi:uncharacterized protein (DUF58 family)
VIVPRTKLIAWTALIVLPFAALAGSWTPAVPVAVLLIGGLVAMALLDAVLARARSTGVRVHLGELLRMQKDRPAVLGVRLFNDSLSAREIKLGLAFPAEIETSDDVRAITLPADADCSQVEWECVARERGLFTIGRVWIEVASPLGFWGWRAAQAVQTELRVYPNLLAERRNVAAIFLRRTMAGNHSQRAAGQGREFEKLREYLGGDSLGDVHWKASAKRGQLVTKVHQIERTHEVYVIVDASRLSARIVESETEKRRISSSHDHSGPRSTFTPQTNALERFVTAAMILGMAAEQQGDQFGLITFSDRVLSFVRAHGGPAHFAACRDRLYTLQPQPVTPDFEELCAFLKLRLRKRALLIFLTALDDPFLAESFVSSSEMLARQHLLLVNTLRPSRARPVFEDGNVTRTDDLYRQLGGHLQWQRLRELEKVLRRRGIRFAALDPANLAADLVQQHAQVRARQLV